MAESTFDQLAEDYKRARPTYVAFTQNFAEVLQSLLLANDIEHLPFEVRTKTWESFEGKIQRDDKAGKYEKVADVTDLSGIRIILYLQEDVEKVCSLISKHFTIDQFNSIKKSEALDPDKFGYLSDHLVISYDATRVTLPEFARFEGLKAEVQVRTLLQHTWAAIDWKFRYKGETQPPKAVRRRLFCISALLEAADDDFSYVSAQISDLRDRYAQGVKEGQLDIELNSESVSAFIAESKAFQAVEDLFEEYNIRIADEIKGMDYLLGTILALGANSIGDLEGLTERSIPKLRNPLQKLSAAIEESESKLGYTRLACLRFALVSAAPKAERADLLQKFPFNSPLTLQALS